MLHTLRQSELLNFPQSFQFDTNYRSTDRRECIIAAPRRLLLLNGNRIQAPMAIDILCDRNIIDLSSGDPDAEDTLGS